MNNAQAAAYFASLPPEKTAMIAAANLDVLTAKMLFLDFFDEDAASWAPQGQKAADWIGKIGVWTGEDDEEEDE